MRTPTSMAGRLFEHDAELPESTSARGRSRFDPDMPPASADFRPRLAAPPQAKTPEPEKRPLRPAQHACYEALSLALKEGHVFAALTGPEGAGKTMVLEAVLADRQDRSLRCIRITDPDKVPAALAAQIEQVAYAEASKPENLDRHVVLAVDDAHTASEDLLRCLTRLAIMREPGRRVPQILLVGRQQLWNRLTAEEFEPLARRIAIRAALPAAEDDADPWATVEAEVTQTMSQLRAEAEADHLPLAPTDRVRPRGNPDPDFEPVPNYHYAHAFNAGPETLDEPVDHEMTPPSMFALFPDPPPAAPKPPPARRRLLMPLVCLFVGLAAFAFALSFYDWPDLFADVPLSSAKPTTPFIMPRSPQAQSFGLPQPPLASAGSPTAPVPMAEPPRTAPTPIAPPPAAPPSAAPPSAASPPATPAPTSVAAAPTNPPIAAANVEARATSNPDPVEAAPVEPRRTPVESSPVRATPEASPPLAVASAAPVSPALVAMLLRRGDEEVAIGDISAARLLFERAAETGNGLAARQLARTYDPAFLPTAVQDTLSDPVKAVAWYRRAVALGAPEAASRIKALNEGR